METQTADFKEFAVWVLILFIVAFAFQYVKEIVSFILDELYHAFIQHNPVS